MDPTNRDFWYPPSCSVPWHQNVGYLCSCGLLMPSVCVCVCVCVPGPSNVLLFGLFVVQYSRLQNVGIWIWGDDYWLSLCLLFWEQRTVLFQLSGLL